MKRASRPARARPRMKARLQIVRRAARPPEAAEVVARIGAAGLIAILRLPDIAGATATASALREAGVSALEVTLTTPEALRGLRPLREAMGPDALLGVGAVVDGPAARVPRGGRAGGGGRGPAPRSPPGVGRTVGRDPEPGAGLSDAHPAGPAGRG